MIATGREMPEFPKDAPRLVFEIKNQRPVELLDLTQSLSAFAKEYQGYAESKGEYEERADPRLYVREIRAGSIVTELVPHVMGVAPLILPALSGANTVIGFAKHLGSLIDLFKGQSKSQPQLSANSARNVKSILAPVVKDHGSQLNINAETVNFGPVYYTINSDEAMSVSENLSRMIESSREPVVGVHRKVVMQWFQTKNDPTSSTGDKAIIESISERAVKLVFDSERIKAQMLKFENNLFHVGFIVDVTVETVRNRPALYRVVDYHGIVEV